MKFFLIVVICFGPICENYKNVEPVFATRDDCKVYAKEVTDKLRNNFPNSHGTTYCFNELELEEVTDNLLKQWQEQLDQFDLDENPTI